MGIPIAADAKGEDVLKASMGLPKERIGQCVCCGLTSLIDDGAYFLFFRKPDHRLVLLHQLPSGTDTGSVAEVCA